MTHKVWNTDHFDHYRPYTSDDGEVGYAIFKCEQGESHERNATGFSHSLPTVAVVDEGVGTMTQYETIERCEEGKRIAASYVRNYNKVVAEGGDWYAAFLDNRVIEHDKICPQCRARKEALRNGTLYAYRSESEVPEITEAEQAFEEKCKKFDWAWFFRDSATPKAQEALMNEAVAGGISFVKIYENYRIRKQNPYCRLEKFLEQKFD